MVEKSVAGTEDSACTKLQEAVMERDQMWRAHEKAQISFLQNQTAQMTRNLHLEIERLTNINRDLNRKLDVSGSPTEDSEKKLEEEEQKNKELQEELSRTQRKANALEKTLERTIQFYKEELNHHEERIRQLTSELHDRTQTVTQLSTQLRSIKLREAMAQAQQRRRASCTSPKSPVSPTEPNSAFRLFGFYSGKPSKSSSFRSASIRTPLWPDPSVENNIEKRSLSTNYIRPRNLASFRRTESSSEEHV